MKKNIPIQKIILAMIAVPGIVAVTAIAPGIGPALKLFGFGKRTYSNKYITNTLSRMKNNGLIRFEERDGKRFVVLTQKGKEKLKKIRSGQYTFKIPKKWDGKWRLVIFDIKEKRRPVRDELRKELQAFGFVRLQHSVWIFPYECEEFIKLLKADHRIGKDTLYIVAEAVEYDRNIKQLFKL